MRQLAPSKRVDTRAMTGSHLHDGEEDVTNSNGKEGCAAFSHGLGETSEDVQLLWLQLILSKIAGSGHHPADCVLPGRTNKSTQCPCMAVLVRLQLKMSVSEAVGVWGCVRACVFFLLCLHPAKHQKQAMFQWSNNCKPKCSCMCLDNAPTSTMLPAHKNTCSKPEWTSDA